MEDIYEEGKERLIMSHKRLAVSIVRQSWKTNGMKFRERWSRFYEVGQIFASKTSKVWLTSVRIRRTGNSVNVESKDD